MDSTVKTLLEKAAQAKLSHHSMQFAQAALSAAHALQVLKEVEKKA